jgi:hypothetical protein
MAATPHAMLDRDIVPSDGIFPGDRSTLPMTRWCRAASLMDEGAA